MALHEETLIDHKFGRIKNANIAEYHVPVNADVHDIKSSLSTSRTSSNPLGIKGLGETHRRRRGRDRQRRLHATGKRVRDRNHAG